MILGKAAAIALAMTIGCGPAEAAYLIRISETASGVVATGSGSVDVSTADYLGTGFVNPGLSALRGSVTFGPSDTFVDAYRLRSVVGDFGGGGSFRATTTIGNTLSIFAFSGFLYVPRGYVSGTDLGLSEITFAGSTFASMGIDPSRRLTVDLGTALDQVTIVFGEEAFAVPEPATWAMMLVGFGLAGASMRSRRRTTVSFA